MKPGDRRTVEAYEAHRGALEGLAYRMTGSFSEAEDIVQEAFLRLHDTPEATIDDPRAWLNTVVARLALDRLRADKRRRAAYPGPWLPEPVFTDDPDRPDIAQERADSLSVAFLVLLETLSPLERAAYLLHDIFDYDYKEVGRILDRSAPACRQLASRARRRLREERPEPGNRTAQEKAVQRFVDAIRNDDLKALLAQLRDDAVLVSDGGGKAPAAPEPVVGAERIARFYLGLAKMFESTIRVEIREINGSPGLVIVDAPSGTVINALSFTVSGDRIAAVHSVVNPDKLAPMSGRA